MRIAKGTVVVAVVGLGWMGWAPAGARAAPVGEGVRNTFSHGMIRVAPAQRTPQAPVIDGRVDDACWSGCPTIGTLRRVDPPGPLQARTDVKVRYGPKHLYLAIVCHEPFMNEVRTRETAHDGPLWRDDSVTVLVDPDHNHREVTAFGVAVGGVTGEGRCAAGSYPDVTWRCPWDVAVTRGTDRWCVEMAVPLVLWKEAPTHTIWSGLDVIRFRYARYEISRWATSTSTSWYDPTALGDLCFNPPELRLWAIDLSGVTQGTHTFRLAVRNRSAQAVPAELTLVTRALGAPSHSLTYQFHAPARQTQQLDLTVPVVGDHNNELSVSIQAQGRGTGRYRCAYPLRVRGLRVPGLGVVRVEPAGRVFLPPDQYAATWTLPRTPARAGRDLRVQAELRGPSTRVVHRATPVPLTTRHAEVVVPLESLSDGVYQVVANVVDAHGTRVAAGSWSIVCLRALNEQLGIETLAQQVSRLGGRVPAGPEWSRAVTLPALSVELAERALRDISPGDVADGQALAAHWAGEARKDIEHLRQRMLPLGGKRGELLRAYRSAVDGSLQAYRVYVPGAYKPGQAIPLVVVLHDRAASYAKDHDLLGRDEIAAAEKQGVMLMAPFGRGNIAYRFEGARDVLDALADVRVFYRIDPDRVYLMGAGMGGEGAWYLGLTRPDVFAAIAPIAARADARLDRPAEWSAAESLALRLTNPYDYLDNATHVPATIVHAAHDRRVPVAHARRMAAGLTERRYAHVLRELPQDGHRRFGEHYEAIFRWFLHHRRTARPDRFELTTHWLGHHHAYWVSIDGVGDVSQRAKVWAHVDGRTLDVDTENVTHLSLDPDRALGTNARPVAVELDGQAFPKPTPADGGLRFHRAGPEGPWQRGLGTESGLRKRPGLQGPIADAMAGPFLVVMGTASPDPAVQAGLRRAVNDFARWWSAERLGALRVKTDRQVTAEDRRRFHLVCYGGSDTNAVVRRWASRLPVRLGPKGVTVGDTSFPGDTLGVRFVYPNPDAPTRYVVVQASRDAGVLSALSWTGPNFDFVVARPLAPGESPGAKSPGTESPGAKSSGTQPPGAKVEVLWAGFFDARWGGVGGQTVSPR